MDIPEREKTHADISITKLSKQIRQIALRLHNGGMPDVEIADIMGESLRTTQRHIAHARKENEQ